MRSRVAGTWGALTETYFVETGTSLSVAGASDGEAIASLRVLARWVENNGHWLQVRGTWRLLIGIWLDMHGVRPKQALAGPVLPCANHAEACA
jgi:hypothetical protein